MNFTLQSMIEALSTLTIGTVYKYASVGRASAGSCELMSVDPHTGTIRYKRNSNAAIGTSTKIESITGANVAKLASALNSRKAVEINALYGGSGNFRSVLEALVANTANVFVCQIDGKKHIFWNPDSSHPVGQITVANAPTVYVPSVEAGQAHRDFGGLSRQLIVYGAPGTGKSWRIKNDTAGKSVIRTTFHPDSDYSTFVGAYKPSMEADEYDTVVTTGEKAAGGTISKKDGLVRQKRIVYKFVAQAFLEAYVKAWRKCAAFLAAQDDNARNAATQFLVIEEINRGNCAQIFGDIFQLLDREDDGYSSYAIKADTDLCQYLKEAFDGGARDDIAALNLDGINLGDRDVTPDEIKNGRKLLLPPNLYIWATMNTSDQSLFPIDSAFKRRWDWKYMPIYDAGKKYRIEVEGDEYDWWNFLEKVNKLVEDVTSSEDKKLGYFFCKAGADGTIPLEKFVGKVIFYLWNSVFKDTEFEGDVFDDGNGGKLFFKTFFNPDGSPNAANVKKFMANLGVTMVSQEGETSHDAE